jgi:pimeloyl-ACP methyl ester carboxylesterase
MSSVKSWTPVAACAMVIAASTGVLAQPGIRRVSVDKHVMRIETAGLERRKPGQPVIVLEAGSGSSLNAWEPVFAKMSLLAPTFAYDRSGLGQSEFDGERPTLPHVAGTLHALLAAAHVPAPYVLVGHSWGGEYIRGFASLYPSEVVGLVYLEATDFERTDEEVDRERPAERRGQGTGGTPPIPDNPPAARMEMQQIIAYGSTGFAEIRALHVPSSLPVAVLVGAAGLTDVSSPDRILFKRLQIRHQGDWVLKSRAGLLLVSTEAGHQVMEDVPMLVVDAVKHVLKASRSTKN